MWLNQEKLSLDCYLLGFTYNLSTHCVSASVTPAQGCQNYRSINTLSIPCVLNNTISTCDSIKSANSVKKKKSINLQSDFQPKAAQMLTLLQMYWHVLVTFSLPALCAGCY